LQHRHQLEASQEDLIPYILAPPLELQERLLLPPLMPHLPSGTLQLGLTPRQTQLLQPLQMLLQHQQLQALQPGLLEQPLALLPELLERPQTLLLPELLERPQTPLPPELPEQMAQTETGGHSTGIRLLQETPRLHLLQVPLRQKLLPPRRQQLLPPRRILRLRISLSENCLRREISPSPWTKLFKQSPTA